MHLTNTQFKQALSILQISAVGSYIVSILLQSCKSYLGHAIILNVLGQGKPKR